MKTRSFFPGTFFFFLLLAGIGSLFSCHKSDFLDKKPSTDLVVPSTLDDFQALLDNDNVMRETPVLGEVSADNFYLLPDFWDGLNLKEKNAYIWLPGNADIFYGGQGGVEDWNIPYQQVFYCNVILDALPKVDRTSMNSARWDAIKGAALFIKANAYYNIAQVFALPYDPGTAATDPGIPLRRTSDVNAPSDLSNLGGTYTEILNELQAASGLLPVDVPGLNLNRPSKPAALALLARVCLSMRDYPNAGLYADSCLQFPHTLLDYNTVNAGSLFPFNKPPVEVLYQSRSLSTSKVLAGLIAPGCIVDSGLYQSYANGDLRKGVFFSVNGSGLPNLKGSYNASIFPFTGLAIDEVYLIKAECLAREGNYMSAMQALNTLLQSRWVTSTYVQLNASSKEEALATILTERRKELPFRGLRWTDLRRFNKEGTNYTLTRVINSQTYHLLPDYPGNLFYILPIPPDVITISGMKQNPR